MSAVGLNNISRAPAIDGRALPDALINALLCGPSALDDPPRSHLTLTRPAVGCFLSHVAIWLWMLRTGLPRVLIIEDDANPTDRHTGTAFRDLISSIPDNVGQVFLGQIIMDGLADTPSSSTLARLYYFNGTFAYLVTAGACTQLVRDLLPMRSHIDHQMSRFFIDHRDTYQAYYCVPAMFEPDWSLRSDCYVPINEDSPADRELGTLLASAREQLIAEGRPLLKPHGELATDVSGRC